MGIPSHSLIRPNASLEVEQDERGRDVVDVDLDQGPADYIVQSFVLVGIRVLRQRVGRGGSGCDRLACRGRSDEVWSDVIAALTTEGCKQAGR